MDRYRRKRRSFFDEIFGIDPLEDMDEMFERLSRAMGMNLKNFGQHPFVYGFSVTQRPGEEPEIREFGNIPRFEQTETGEKHYIDTRRPLIDVLEAE
ncbi:MAG: Hsp20/alpha crystallin family protein, partial [Methanosarcina flavescens]